MRDKLLIKTNSGFIALTTVLLILAVVLMIGLSLSLLGISEAQMGLQKNQSSRAYYLANLCAEETLMELKENSGYTADETKDIEDGSCMILVEGNWIVKVSANFQNQIRKMKIVISQLQPEMIVDSWEEVADF